MKTNYNKLLVAFFGIAFLMTSCSNDDDNGILAPEVAMAIQEQVLQYYVGDTSTFSASNQNNSVYTETWSLGDSIVSNTDTYTFEPKNSGTYSLSYAAANAAGTFNYEYTIKVTPKLRPITAASKAFVTDLLDYTPAPGQFINKKPGNLESAEGIIGGRGLVSLGGWGGSVTYAFDHTVLNHEDKNDLIVYGNAMPTFSEPGVIYVMQDDNANGLPDDIWYEIKGSGHALEGIDRAYNITYFRPATAEDDVPWEDSKGNTGVIAKNAFHKQAYYPEWITEDSYTIAGTLLSDSNIDMSNPSYITSKSFEYGYADNTSGGDQIDLADAIDEEGNTVNLSGVDFIKIQTGVQANMGWLGELSTEVTGIADLNMID
ncbi:PKD domain-containing protein [Gelidibacter salicanalis]|uniref:PKD domain-containing protein n=1 Tax=Gelidibacter salicanalis TaxID=291193 RepID=A0A934KNB6_9FLAO|nr:PKD domain-containing protein [Gelidibacter salicanalis]MBJ7882412.1 PKD domain-containing protein [Gelidibacter salicanalis]